MPNNIITKLVQYRWEKVLCKLGVGISGPAIQILQSSKPFQLQRVGSQMSKEKDFTLDSNLKLLFHISIVWSHGDQMVVSQARPNQLQHGPLPVLMELISNWEQG